MIKENVEGQYIPNKCETMFYFSKGEFYYYDNNKVCLLNNRIITNEEFENYSNIRKKGYFNLTYDILEGIKLNNIAQINNLIYLNQYDLCNQTCGNETYEGQDSGAYGYGGIIDCKEYLEDRYGGNASLSSAKSLTMQNFKMSNLESNANNCTLVAITRILRYYYDKGYRKIDSSRYDIYKQVKSVAAKYGYTAEDGVGFTKINNIVDDVLDYYGYGDSICKGIYAWDFDTEVKDEINAGRPVVMNIARGYYGNHTITVCGYKIYSLTKNALIGTSTKKYNMIEVYDGWESSKRYIDYNAFAYDLLTSGFGSFNKIIMVK